MTAREALAGNGSPTLRIEVHYDTAGETKHVCITAPLGSSHITQDGTTWKCNSVGSEPVHLVDADNAAWYQRRGVQGAVKNVASSVAPVLIGLDPRDQSKIDVALDALDTSESKATIGGNTINAASLAVFSAAAHYAQTPLYRYIIEIQVRKY